MLSQKSLPLIVLIEDDAGHARLIERNLRRAHVTSTIVRLQDGQAALDYFFPQQEGEVRRPYPILILLDMNLPGADGLKILARLKSHEHTKHIPVIVLTTTDDPETIEACYELGCNMYLVKPLDYDLFMEALQTLGILLSRIAIPQGPPYRSPRSS